MIADSRVVKRKVREIALRPRLRNRQNRVMMLAMPLLIDRSIATIRGYCSLMDWTRSKLATKAGLSEHHTRKLFDADWSPTVDHIRRLEALVPDYLRDEAERRGIEEGADQ